MSTRNFDLLYDNVSHITSINMFGLNYPVDVAYTSYNDNELARYVNIRMLDTSVIKLSEKDSNIIVIPADRGLPILHVLYRGYDFFVVFDESSELTSDENNEIDCNHDVLANLKFRLHYTKRLNEVGRPHVLFSGIAFPVTVNYFVSRKKLYLRYASETNVQGQRSLDLITFKIDADSVKVKGTLNPLNLSFTDKWIYDLRVIMEENEGKSLRTKFIEHPQLSPVKDFEDVDIKNFSYEVHFGESIFNVTKFREWVYNKPILNSNGKYRREVRWDFDTNTVNFTINRLTEINDGKFKVGDHEFYLYEKPLQKVEITTILNLF